MKHAWERWKMHMTLWLENLKDGDHRPRHKWEDNIKLKLMEYGVMV
jgi:hypothetical protein